MRKFLAMLIVFVAFALSACGTTEAPEGRGPKDTTAASQFLTLVTTDEYEEHDNKTWGWTDVDPLTEVEVGDELTFVLGYLRGTYRAELNEWNWNIDDENVSVSGLPLVWPHDEGNVQTVRTFEWTPSRDGEYHFNLWLSDQGGNPREGAPIELVVVVGDHGDDDDPQDPDDGDDNDDDVDFDDLLNWFNVTLDHGDEEVENGDEVELDGGDGGISVNWSVDSVDSVELTVVNEGDEIYESTSRTGSRWISFGEFDEGDVVVRLQLEENGENYSRTIRFEVVDDDGSSSSDECGTVEFEFRGLNGLDVDDVRLRFEDRDGDLIGYVDDGDEFDICDSRNTARVVGDDHEIDRVTTDDCAQLSGIRLRVDAEDNEGLLCRIYFFEVDDDTDDDERCEDAVAHIMYNGNCYEHFVFVSRSGPDFELNWDMSTRYDRYYVQLYRVGVGDLYQSTARSGSSDIDPSDLPSGDYEFRVTGYDGSNADLWTVGLRVP